MLIEKILKTYNNFQAYLDINFVSAHNKFVGNIIVVSAFDKQLTFMQLTFMVNITVTNNTERRCTGINRM